MKLLFIDFETQCDQAQTTNATEVGALMVEHQQANGLDFFSRKSELSLLIHDLSYPPQTEEIVELTGITDDTLQKIGVPPVVAFGHLAPLIREADYVLAHNKVFDQTVYESVAARIGVPVEKPKKGWLCTIQDIPWAPKYKCKKLSHLAYDHGIMVDPKTLHRALDDVKLLYRLVAYSYPNFDEVLRYANCPWVYLRAVILGPWQGPGGDGGVGKAQASKLGYSWERARGTDGPVFPKAWVKRVKEDRIEAEKAAAPFKIMRLSTPAAQTF